MTDLERSLDFYKRLPGAKVVVYRPDEFAMLRIGHGRLGLLQARLPVPFHMEFESPDLNNLYEDLRLVGIEPSAPAAGEGVGRDGLPGGRSGRQ